MAPLPFQLSTASLIGQGHLAVPRNNQDGLAIAREPGLLVAVVTDGCSAAPSSEVGARLGARWLAEWIPHQLRFAADDAGLIEATRAGLLEFMAVTAKALAPRAYDLPRVVRDHFLFTFLVAVVEAERTRVFGVGDGLALVNGQVTVLDPGPTGAPSYLAYALIREALAEDPGPLVPALIHSGPTSAIDSLLIGTDGLLELVPGEGGAHAGETLDALMGSPLFAQDPQALEATLRQAGPLHDDATAVLLRRND